MISSSLTALVLIYGPQVFFTMQISWFFYMKYLQQGLLFGIHIVNHSSASWLKLIMYVLVTDGFQDGLWVFLEV